MPLSFTTAQRNLLGARRYTLHVWTEVTNSEGEWVDFRTLGGIDWFHSARWTDNFENPMMEGSASFIREHGDVSLAPYMEDSPLNHLGGLDTPAIDGGRGIRIRTAYTAPGVVPTDDDFVEVFVGYIGNPEWGESDAQLVNVVIRDLGYALMTQWTQEPKDYVLTPMTMEAALQQILNDNPSEKLGPLTLYTPVSPGVTLGKKFTVDSKPVLLALRDVAAEIGWSVKFKYDAAGNFRLTLFVAPRDKTEPDYSLGINEYEQIPSFKVPTDDVRNIIHVEGTPPGGATIKVTLRDEASIKQYGPQYAGIRNLLNIDTLPEITALATAVKQDLAQPYAQQQVKLPFFWIVQTGDLIAFEPNYVMYDRIKNLGVNQFDHELADGDGTTTIYASKQIAGAVNAWLVLANQAPPLPTPPNIIPKVILLDNGTQADFELKLTSEFGEGLTAWVKQGTAADAAIWILCVGEGDPTTRYVDPGTVLDHDAWFTNGGFYWQILKDKPRDLLVTTLWYALATGKDSELSSTWVTIPLDAQSKAEASSIDMRFIEGNFVTLPASVGTLKATAIAGKGCKRLQVQIATDPRFSYVLVPNVMRADTGFVATAEGDSVTATYSLTLLSERGLTYYARAVPCTSLTDDLAVGIDVRDSLFVPGYTPPSLIDTTGANQGDVITIVSDGTGGTKSVLGKYAWRSAFTLRAFGAPHVASDTRPVALIECNGSFRLQVAVMAERFAYRVVASFNIPVAYAFGNGDWMIVPPTMESSTNEIVLEMWEDNGKARLRVRNKTGNVLDAIRVIVWIDSVAVPAVTDLTADTTLDVVSAITAIYERARPISSPPGSGVVTPGMLSFDPATQAELDAAIFAEASARSGADAAEVTARNAAIAAALATASSSAAATIASSRLSFFELFNSEAVIATIPAAATEVDTRLRRLARFTNGASARIVANITTATTSGAVLRFDFSTDSGATWTALATTLGLGLTGPRGTLWFAVPAGMLADNVWLRVMTTGGDDVATVRLSSLALEISGITVANPAAYVPSTGMFLRYDVSAMTPVANNTTVTGVFTDQSGNGNHGTLSGTPKYIVNAFGTGKPGLFFGTFFGSTGNGLITLPGMSALTAGEIFIVIKTPDDPAVPATFGGGWWYMSASSPGNDDALPTGSATAPATTGAIVESFGSATRVTLTGARPSFTTPRLYNVAAGVATYDIRLDTASLFTRASNTVNFPGSGDPPTLTRTRFNQNYWTGHLAEVIIYDHVLNSTDRAALEQALKIKWGLTGY